jgi:hypothetical protein
LLDRKGAAVTGLTACKPLARVGGQGRTVDSVHGNLAYLRSATGSGVSLVLAKPQMVGFNENTVVATGQSPAALGGAQIASLGEPAVNANGNVAFSVGLTGNGVTAVNRVVLALSSGASVNFPVRLGAFAPDSSGAATASVFTRLSDPVLNNHDRLAFAGTLKLGGGVTGANANGLWSDADGTMKLIARQGDAAPGVDGAKFSAFQQFVLPDVGGVVFLATVSGVPATQNQGVWALLPTGKLELVVRTGDLFDLRGAAKTIRTLAIFQVAPGVMGQSRSFDASTARLVYKATFTDGTWGVYSVSTP